MLRRKLRSQPNRARIGQSEAIELRYDPVVLLASRITVMDGEIERCALCDDETSVARIRVISDGEPRKIAVCQRHFADMLRKIEARRYGQDVVRDETPAQGSPLALAYLFGL